MKTIQLFFNRIFASDARALRRSIFFLFFFTHTIHLLQAQPCTSTLNGNYTVGPGGDFITLTAAANAYNSSCIAGPVTLSLIATSYSSGETFPILFDRNVNAGPNTMLLIRPSIGNQVSISGSVNSGALIKIQGDYIQIDGSNNGTLSRNLTLINTSILEPRVIHYASVGTDAVTNCVIRNCELINGNNDKSVLLISDAATPANAGYCSNIIVENNSFKKALYGVYCKLVSASLNGSGIQVISNLLNNTNANAIQFCGVYMEGVDGGLIKDNQIGNFVSSDSATDKGIWLASGVKNTNILGNKIAGLHHTGGKGMGAHGILISSGVSNANITVTNNMIWNITGDGNDYTNAIYTLENPTGILLTAATAQGGVRLYHNTIYLGGTNGFTNTLNRPNAISVCIRLRASCTADIRNNIIVNNLGLSGSTGFGAMAILVSSSSAQLDQLNYNDYYVNPTGAGVKLIGHVFAGNVQSATLSAWRTASGKDAASLNLSPNFISATDVHLNAANNSGLNNKGIYLTGYANDIDNTSRHPLTPDMGADEFVPVNTSNWIGTQSVNWSNELNWEANVIPDQNTDLEINTGYPYLPRVNVNSKLRSLSLTGNANATMLVIDSAVNIEVHGAMTRTSGCIDASKATLTFVGNAMQQLPAGILCNNQLNQLYIGNSSSSGLNLGGPLEVSGSVQFLPQGVKLNTNGNLTLKSSASGTAYVGDLTDKIINGDVTVERFIPTGINHGKSWQFLAVPVYGNQTINQAWQDSSTSANQNRYSGYGTQLTSNISPLPPHFDVYTPAGPSIKTYNSVTNFWEGLSNTNNTPIANSKGYFVFVRGDRSVTTSTAPAVPTILRAKGKLFSAAPDALPPQTVIPANGFESIGNPYASAIDIRNIMTSGGADQVFYVWDPTLVGTRGLGGYHAISIANGFVPVPGGTLNYPSGQPCTRIESGQAFFMYATGTSGLVSFSEACKLSGSRNNFRSTASLTPSYASMIVSLFSGASMSDRIVDGCALLMDSTFAIGHDGHEAVKLMNGGENLAILNSSKCFAIESRGTLSDNDTVQLFINNLKKQTYEFRIKSQQVVFANSQIYLADRYTGMQTMISNVDITRFSFAVNDDPASYNSLRFYLIKRSVVLLPMHFINANAVRHTSEINFDWQVADADQVSGYVVMKSRDAKNYFVCSDTIPSHGMIRFGFKDRNAAGIRLFYKIRAVENNSFRESLVMSIEDKKYNAASMMITSEPEQHRFVIELNKDLENDAQICMYNETGQVILRQNMFKNTRRAICIYSRLSTGVYVVQLSDIKKTINISEQVILRSH